MKINYLLIGILAAAFFLRVWALGIIPFGFTPDEASFGYDAYSLLLTGKDQWGHTFPIVLESFGDFKLPLYSYLTMPFVALFGLTKLAVRLPNALLGTAAVYATYLLVRELFKNFKKRNNTLEVGLRLREPRGSERDWGLGILSAALLAISPWHIMMSRGAFEANLTTFFMTLGTYLFIRGIKQRKYIILSSIIFGFNLFSYHSARLVTPLIVLTLVVIYRKEIVDRTTSIVKNVLNYRFPILIFIFFLSFAFYSLFLGGARRAGDISIFPGSLEQASQERFVAIYQGMPLSVAKVFHNKYEVVFRRFLDNYSQYFSFRFLFSDGPAEGTYGMIPGMGVMYLFELPFLLFFLLSFFRSENKKPFLFILAWLLISPIPAALTSGRGFAGNRSVIMLPALTIASAIGAYELFLSIGRGMNVFMLRFALFVYLFICLLFFASFLEDYFVLSPYKTSKDMLWGNLEVGTWLVENSAGKKEILVSRDLSEPHIYVAFANKWAPVDYQNNSKNWSEYKNMGLKFLDQMDGYKLGKYTFGSINYNPENVYGDVLIVGKPSGFPTDIKPRIRFISPSGETVLVAFEPVRQAYAQKIN